MDVACQTVKLPFHKLTSKLAFADTFVSDSLSHSFPTPSHLTQRCPSPPSSPSGAQTILQSKELMAYMIPSFVFCSSVSFSQYHSL